MVSTASPRTSYDDNGSSDEDWPTQVADTIERVVGSVRDNTTGRLVTVAKVVIYGTFAGLVVIVALVVFTIGAVRLLNNYLPDFIFGEYHMWASYLILGLIFVILGAICWARRRTPEQTSRY